MKHTRKIKVKKTNHSAFCRAIVRHRKSLRVRPRGRAKGPLHPRHQHAVRNPWPHRRGSRSPGLPRLALCAYIHPFTPPPFPSLPSSTSPTSKPHQNRPAASVHLGHGMKKEIELSRLTDCLAAGNRTSSDVASRTASRTSPTTPASTSPRPSSSSPRPRSPGPARAPPPPCTSWATPWAAA